MRRFVLAFAFASAAAGSPAAAGDWYRCMFGGPFCGDYCVGQPGYDYGCAGCSAGLTGGFYDCGCLFGRCGGRRCGRPACGTSTCCGPAAATCCGAAAPSCRGPIAPSCCAPTGG